MMRCERLAASMSVAACRRRWQAANADPQGRRPNAWDSLSKCLGCPVGARHAGATDAEQAARAVVEALRNVCARCLRHAERGDRRRALVHGEHCVSCYNRSREVTKGRNAKGNPPRQVLAALRPERLIVVAAAARRGDAAAAIPVPAAYERVAGRVEALVLAAKRSGGPVLLGRPALGLGAVLVQAGAAPDPAALRHAFAPAA